MKRKVIKRLKRKVNPYKHTVGIYKIEDGYKFNREKRKYEPCVRLIYWQERGR